MSFKLLSPRFSQSRAPYPYTVCNELHINQHTVRDIFLHCFPFEQTNTLGNQSKHRNNAAGFKDKT